MREFTYRSARSGSLVAGLGLVIVVETTVLHLWLRTQHPVLAWTLTLSSLSALAWLATDYHGLGRGAIRVDRDAIDLRVGRRVSLRVPLQAVATVVRPSWRDVPAAGAPGSADYRNLMKPAAPNVLVTLAEPTTVRLLGAVARPVRRIGLRVDDPDGFIAACDSARALVGALAI
jgi:hypothetical protein